MSAPRPGGSARVGVGVLASGTGSILEAMLQAGVPVAVVVVDRRCRAERVAESAGVASLLVERESFGPGFDRGAYTARVVEALRGAGVELVAMAGFGTVLSRAMFEAFPCSVLNTHPSLLPAFAGWHAVRDALEAGVAVTGCTVHLATEVVDAGTILAQAEVPVLAGDTVESLHERIKALERRLYPATVLEVLAARARAVAPRRPR